MSAVARRRFDPANDVHYAISQEDEYHLRRIAEAADTVGMLFAADNNEADLSGDAISAVFQTFAFAIKGVLGSAAEIVPGKRA